MSRDIVLRILESLSSGVRLDAYRLLVHAEPEGLVAGEIAARLNIPPTNLSFHMKALTHAGLAQVTQEGRYQRYRANIPLMLEVITYLSESCCGDRPELCAGLPVVQPTSAKIEKRK